MADWSRNERGCRGSRIIKYRTWWQNVVCMMMEDVC